MPAPASQAARPTENNLNKYGPGLETMRKKGLAFDFSLNQLWSVIFSYKKKWIRWAKSKIPSTEANDSCQPASNRDVGLMSKRIIAANDNVLTGSDFRRNKNDTQKTKEITAALSIGGRGETTSKKTIVAIMQTTDLAGLDNPIVLQTHHKIPIKIPR